MDQRVPRGIQYEDVAQAADALLQEGIRPTIERIRLHIGRGSPNTVSPMLERWFSSLGQRLRMHGSPEQGAIPEAVLETASRLWEKAFAEAQAQSELACAAQRAHMEDEARHLMEAKDRLKMHEHAANERLKTMQDALQLCSQQLEESNTRWQTSQRAVAAQNAEMAASQAALVRAREQAEVLQHRLDSVQSQAKEEQAVLNERYCSSERRWLAEVDRARQEARKSFLLAQDHGRRLAALQQETENIKAAHHTIEVQQALQIGTLRHELASALQSKEQAQFLLQQAQRSGSGRDKTPYKESLVNLRSLPIKRKLGRREKKKVLPNAKFAMYKAEHSV